MATPFGAFEPGGALSRLIDSAEDSTSLVKKMGAYILAKAQQSFRTQSRGPFGWKPRRIPNVAGILADLRAGNRPPERRFQPRPALKDRGDLAKSLHRDKGLTNATRDSVLVGSNLKYAGLHQFGGEVDIPIDDGLKTKILGYIKSLEGSAAKQEKIAFGGGPSSGNFPKFKAANDRAELVRQTMGWLAGAKVKGLTYRVPARPFVAVTDEDMRKLAEIAVTGALRGVTT